MKLNTEHKVKLCQKALYTKQLVYYSKLCEIYQALANHALTKYRLKPVKNDPIAKQVENIYGSYLSDASRGDISFLEKYNYPISFDEEESRLFKLFSSYSSAITQFKDASSLLDVAIKPYGPNNMSEEENPLYIDEEVLKNYYDYMETTSPYTKKFNDFINQNPSIWIGKISYNKSKVALQKIREIDASHIIDLPEYSERISPKSFGVNIGRVRGRINPLPQELSSEIKTFYSDEENKKYTKPISNVDELKFVSYSLGNKFKEKYTAHKGTLKKALGIASSVTLIALLAFNTVTHINTAHTFSGLSATTNYENGRQVLVNQNTQDEIKSIKEKLESLKVSPSVPTDKDFQEIRDRLDVLITNVISDLTTKAFKETYPDYTDISVRDEYDLNANRFTSSDNPEPNAEEYVIITAKDPEGIEKTFVIGDFSAPKGDPLGDNISNEEILDGAGKSKNSPGKILHKQLKNISSISSAPYTEKIENIEEIFKTFDEIIDNVDKLAGTKFTIKKPGFLTPNLSISVGIPDEIHKDISESNYKNSNNIDNEGR